MKVVIDRETCLGCDACDICYSICPTNAISLDDDGKLEYDFLDCDYCGDCEEYCPVNAITVR